MTTASPSSWPYTSLTKAPTNLKEAIDWVLRVTGKDGKKNEKAAQPPQFGCLCFLAKAVKDLLYDAFIQYSTENTNRDYTKVLLQQEKDIVQPILKDLGLLSDKSTTSSTTYTNAGGTEVIRALIDHLALGLQKWVGWQDDDTCCLGQTKGGKSDGIGKGCERTGTSCCIDVDKPSHECDQCGKGEGNEPATNGSKKCYLSAYQKNTVSSNGTTPTDFLWTSISSDPDKVHLLARIFLGSVCLIWSGLSQLGWLTGDNSNNDVRWNRGIMSDETKGLGSFMAAMGYDLNRLDKASGYLIGNVLTGIGSKGIQWQEFKNGPPQDSVAEYYSSIYGAAQGAAKGKSTESICKQYPLLVLHILASGYFRAGSAGANKVTVPAKSASSDPKKDNTPRKPRTIREILYWLSALPYSQGYKDLVERMKEKYPRNEKEPQKPAEKIELYNEGTSGAASTTLQRKDITHYLMAACGYCPLVLIGIQGTIEKEVKSDAGASGSAGQNKRCEKHKKDPKSKRCIYDEKNKATASAATGEKLKEGEVCYGGYHLEVSKFGPLHGMYANGLYGFDMGGSAAQCLDQLRIYVYHCFYQLYFLRKQCKVGVVMEGGKGVALGWQSCRYGSGLSFTSSTWSCSPGTPGKGQDCQCKTIGTKDSPLMAFLCDGITALNCPMTRGKGVDDYHPIETHWTTRNDNPPGHFGTKELDYPKLCPVPMGWSAESPTSSTSGGQVRVNHFKDLNTGTHKKADLAPPVGKDKYPAHCTGNTLSLLLEYYCDPVHCPSGTLVVLLRLLACITPTVPRTLGDLFGFYYYIVYIGGELSWKLEANPIRKALQNTLGEVSMGNYGIFTTEGVVRALTKWNNTEDGGSSGCTSGSDCKKDTLKCLYTCPNGAAGKCCPYLSPLSGQQYGQLSPRMAGTYLSWLVYLIGGFKDGLDKLRDDYMNISCKGEGCSQGKPGAGTGCGGSTCQKGSHGNPCPSAGSAVGGKGGSGSGGGVCGCTSVVSCTGVLPVLYKYGFGYGNVTELHNTTGGGPKTCDAFLTTLKGVLNGQHIKHDGSGLHYEINKLIYTTRLPWIFVLTIAWLVAVLYLAFGAIWPLDWTHMRSHCRGWFRKGSLSPWEILMVGKKKGRGILEFFGGK